MAMHAKARHARCRSTKGKDFLRPHLEDMIYEDFDDDVAMPGIVWKAMLDCVMIFFRIRG